MEEPTYFVCVRSVRYNNTVFEMDNLSRVDAFDKAKFYLSGDNLGHYLVTIYDNEIEEYVSPSWFLHDEFLSKFYES